MNKQPVARNMCATCPFRDGSPHSDLQLGLTLSALTEASRICHSTGSNNLFHRRTGKPEELCRGARNAQLQTFAAMGFISAPTDEAWDAKTKELGL